MTLVADIQRTLSISLEKVSTDGDTHTHTHCTGEYTSKSVCVW